MKKDIPIRKVTDVAVAVVPGAEEEDLWDVFLINLKSERLRNVLINSRGYGEMDGERVETTRLRYYFEEIAPQTAIKIEPIQVKLFSIANEYWVSFQHDGFMYDRKYVFVRGSISENYFTTLPIIEQKGIMIK